MLCSNSTIHPYFRHFPELNCSSKHVPPRLSRQTIWRPQSSVAKMFVFVAPLLQAQVRLNCHRSSDFQVTAKLPNVTFPLGRSFAGNIPVQRPGHPNDTLFFVGFEKCKGSLTAPSNPANRDPWGIWLNGGSVQRKRLLDIISLY